METYIIKVNGETYEVEVEKKENSASGKSVAVKRETAEKIETSGCPVKTEMAGKMCIRDRSCAMRGLTSDILCMWKR